MAKGRRRKEEEKDRRKKKGEGRKEKIERKKKEGRREEQKVKRHQKGREKEGQHEDKITNALRKPSFIQNYEKKHMKVNGQEKERQKGTGCRKRLGGPGGGKKEQRLLQGHHGSYKITERSIRGREKKLTGCWEKLRMIVNLVFPFTVVSWSGG